MSLFNNGRQEKAFTPYEIELDQFYCQVRRLSSKDLRILYAETKADLSAKNSVLKLLLIGQICYLVLIYFLVHFVVKKVMMWAVLHYISSEVAMSILFIIFFLVITICLINWIMVIFYIEKVTKLSTHLIYISEAQRLKKGETQ